MTTKTNKKRQLSDIDFSHEGAHIALVSKEQGGPANNHNYALIMKAANFKPATLEKAQRVKVTMELPDFLRKFFNLYYDDSILLATILGYEIEEESYEAEYYQDWIEEKLTNFEFIQKAHDADDLSEFVGNLSDTAYLSLLRTQSKIEKAMKKAEGTGALSSVESKGSNVTKSNTEITSDDNKENKMTQEEIQKSIDNAVAAAVAVAVEKAKEENKAALEKAQSELKAYRELEKQAVQKAKSDTLAESLDAAQVEAVLKATAELDDENFKALVGVFKAMKEQVEKSALFQEAGVDADETVQMTDTAGAVANLLKSRFQPQ